MPDPVTKKPKPRLATPRRYRSRQFFVEMGNGEHFRVRKTDLPSLLMEGILPTPMLAAVEHLDEFRNDVSKGKFSDALKRVADNPEKWRGVTEMMRRCAVAFVLEPKLTHSKQQAQNHPDEYLWVGGASDVGGEQQREEEGDLPTSDLLKLWRAIMGEVGGGVFVMSDEDAEEFRARESRSDAAAVPDGAASEGAPVGSTPAIADRDPAPASAAPEAEVVETLR